jgi:hypothetical protein
MSRGKTTFGFLAGRDAQIEYLDNQLERHSAPDGNDSDGEDMFSNDDIDLDATISALCERGFYDGENYAATELSYSQPQKFFGRKKVRNRGVYTGKNAIIAGAPDGWKPTGPTQKWIEDFEARKHKAKVEKGEPKFFEKLDNPGKWSRFAYGPEYNKKTGKYIRHRLPTGATVATISNKSEKGTPGYRPKRIVKEGDKEYELAEVPGMGATRENLFPDSRKGSLDLEKLEACGLSKDRIKMPLTGKPDCLFFLLLLRPVHDTSKIPNDPRTSYYGTQKLQSTATTMPSTS